MNANMSISTEPTLGTSGPWDVGPALHRFTVDEYRRLLAEDARVELLDGWVFDMPPIGPSHSFGVENGRDALATLLSAGWHLRTQQPVALGTSEPQPDLAIVRGTRGDYVRRHPGASDIGLLVEVSESSLELDRGLKRAVYAAAGITEYWIVSVIERRVEVFQRPRGPTVRRPAGYGRRRVVGGGKSLPLVLDGRAAGQLPVNVFFS
jgi:Uma2 family endonuclease